MLNREQLSEMRDVLKDVAKVGAVQVLTEIGQLKPFITKAEAYRLYGRTKVDMWIRNRLVTPRGGFGEKWRLERSELEAISASASLAAYVNSMAFKDKGVKVNLDELK
ncbi:hypothetical protein [Parapedobacter indicus]|nr:hypothetical protein [Parapedobacter indicus]